MMTRFAWTSSHRLLAGALVLTGLSACHMIGGPTSPRVVTMTFGGASVEVLGGRMLLRVDEFNTEAQEIAVAVQCDGEEETFVVGPTSPEPEDLHCNTLFQVVEINQDNGEARSVRLRMSWED